MLFRSNHDEPRIAGKLPALLQRAAAVTIATLPGATLWHEGQFEGRRVRVPVFLDRRPGAGLLQPAGWPDNQSARNLIAWCWTPGDDAGDVRRQTL